MKLTTKLMMTTLIAATTLVSSLACAAEKSPLWPDAKAAAETTGAITTAPGTARLNGAFLCIGSDKETWTDAQWDQEFKWLRDMGMRELILAHMAVKDKAFFPIKADCMKPMGNYDLIEPMMAKADKYGLKMHLGLILDDRWWTGINATFLDDLSSRSIALATAAYERYKHHSSLAGFYITNEIDNITWVLDYPFTLVTNHFLKPISKHIKSLNKDLIVSQAPFFNAENPITLRPDKLGKFWDRLLEQVPDLDWIIPQDGVGCYHATIAEATDYFREMAKACKKHHRTLWSDLETFDMKQKKSPIADIRRVTEQLKTQSAVVNGFVFWEYLSTMSPAISRGGQELYLQYKHYLYGGKPLIVAENVDTNIVCGVEPVAGSLELLTDGEFGTLKRMQVIWAEQKVKTPVDLTVNLHSNFKSIADFRALFMNDAAQKIAAPERVTVDISDDGQNFTPFSEIKPVVTEYDKSIPQLLMWTIPETSKTVSAKAVRFTIYPRPDALTACQELQVLTEEPVINPNPRKAPEMTNLALNKKYEVTPEPSKKYPDTDNKKLTNGDATPDFGSAIGWLAPKEPITATIDLGEVQPVRRVECAYLYSPGAGVLFPQEIRASFSTDGKQFTDPLKLELEQAGNEEISSYQIDPKDVQARYVRVSIVPTTDKGEWYMPVEILVLK